MALGIKSKGTQSYLPPQSNPGGCHVRGSWWSPEPNTKVMRNPWEAESDTVPVEREMNAYSIDGQMAHTVRRALFQLCPFLSL